MHSSPPPSFVNHKSLAVSKRQRLPSPVVKERKKKSMTADTNSTRHSKFEGSRGEWITGGHKKKQQEEELQPSNKPSIQLAGKPSKNVR